MKRLFLIITTMILLIHPPYHHCFLTTLLRKKYPYRNNNYFGARGATTARRCQRIVPTTTTSTSSLFAFYRGGATSSRYNNKKDNNHNILWTDVIISNKYNRNHNKNNIIIRRQQTQQQRMVSSSSLSSSSLFHSVVPVQEEICTDPNILQNILQRIRACNYFPDDIRKTVLEFKVDGISLGLVRPSIAKLLCSVNVPEIGRPMFTIKMSDDSNVNNNNNNVNYNKSYLTLTEDAGWNYETRTRNVAIVTELLRQKGIVKGWRDELLGVYKSFYEPPIFAIERAAIPLLGTPEYGVHVNGLVVQQQQQQQQQQDSDSTTKTTSDVIKMWMARRSKTKSKFPGMIDHIVAGGQPVGISLYDNVIKECAEEAGIPIELAISGLRSAGVISYECYFPKSDLIQQVVLFNYDLYLPESFQPIVVDGEVEEFFLWDINQILQSMSMDYHDPIKPNCYVVIIDFLIRHGYISPDVPGYLDIVRELRSGNCR